MYAYAAAVQVNTKQRRVFRVKHPLNLLQPWYNPGMRINTRYQYHYQCIPAKHKPDSTKKKNTQDERDGTVRPQL